MTHNTRLQIFLISLFIGISATVSAETLSLKSPDGKLRVAVNTGNQLTYSVKDGGQIILAPSAIGMTLENGAALGKNPHKVSVATRSAKETINATNYRFASFTTQYNELKITFKGNYGVIFRAYDEGVAYRFFTTMGGNISIKDELAEFNFDKDYTSYMPHSTGKKDPFAMAFQSTYEVKPLTQTNQTLPAFLPLTVDLLKGKKLTITESDLEDYPGMFIQSEGKTGFKGLFAPLPSKVAQNAWRKQEYVTERANFIAQTSGTREFPWRVLAITRNDTEMPVNNLVYALASPPRIKDFSWVKGGKSAWEWWNDWGISGVNFKAGINTETYKHYIEFASQNGLEYVILDEGWYKPSSGDMLTVIPEINLPELISYAKSKNVGIILWTVFNVLDSQLEAACKKYSEMGIKGFKVDFLDRDDQKAVQMTYRIAEMTARYKLTLDLHGFYKPTGLNRTYPNIINFESVFGMEEMKWSTPEVDMPTYDVTFPFIRLMAGPVDYTPGAMRNSTKSDFKPIYSNPLSQGTRCHQLATYIVFDSPLTMLADNPTIYQKEQECTSFIASLPNVTDETKILQGKLGEYIVSARRKDKEWTVGALTNWTERDIALTLDFLKKGIKYQAEIFSDGINANKQASDYQREILTVTSDSTLKLHLASGGGFAIRLTELNGDKVTAVPQSLHLYPFYKKYLDAGGMPVVSSHQVSDKALYKAREIIMGMLSKRKDIARYMIGKGCRVMVIGANEQVCELPEYAHICNSPDSIAYWNKRARGFGGSPEDDFSCSCGEENLICLSGDKYEGENILIHEFAHIFHMVGIVGVNPNFNNELETVMKHAIEKGLWEKTYALSNKEEYFAEAVQSFFNCNRYSETPNGVHNSINRREKLKKYDPEMYNLLLKYFAEIDIPISNKVHE
ncbi:glycoside hydrolase family 97 catalytic domain-containing protein [Parabacteroides sp. FAFU027]|uniref:glycoside hydrolase family 97 catalytic domain-containing protein n=1 Tax=Parabacteroides sp. FAFU027 TaxID=2922715 RepID=UPI001FB01852|nr:glycoside hydrolase family 97 catalytic domain-containing protein [Parabacteroides sp. FAFU027]